MDKFNPKALRLSRDGEFGSWLIERIRPGRGINAINRFGRLCNYEVQRQIGSGLNLRDEKIQRLDVVCTKRRSPISFEIVNKANGGCMGIRGVGWVFSFHARQYLRAARAAGYKYLHLEY